MNIDGIFSDDRDQDRDRDQDQTETTAGNTVDNLGGLPFDFLQTLQSIIKQWCSDNNIDNLAKAPALQWGACCMFIGQYIKVNGILYDVEKTKKRGGSPIYDIKKVMALIDLWGYLCQIYGKTPLVTDFAYFGGFSLGWLYGKNGHSDSTLTSASGEVVKKLSEIQAAAIGAGLVDGRENPTGKIYFSKAVLGWSESGGMRPADVDQGGAVDGLPDLSGLLLSGPAKKG